MKAKQSISWLTRYYADSAEFCPVSPYHDIFVVGTYQLEENKAKEHEDHSYTFEYNSNRTQEIFSSSSEINPGGQSGQSSAVTSEIAESHRQTRLGCLYLHRFSGTGVENLQEIEMAGILDMKWSCQRISSLILLGVVTSCGEIVVLKLKENGDGLEELCKENLKSDGALALSLDWSNPEYDFQLPHITVSDSKGCVRVYELNNSSLKLLHEGSCHSFEAWITAFNHCNPNTVYSGGDDCQFKGYDMRIGFEAPSFVSRVHESGVTSCHANGLLHHWVATGSYDEMVRVWDDRQMRRPIREARVDGGVWRLKWRPHDKECLLAACMYNHFQIISMLPAGKAEVAAKYEEHSSIAYGADWCWSGKFPNTLVAASFYDRTVSIFTVSEDE